MRGLADVERIVHILQRYDLVVLTHTGRDTETDVQLPGFTCVRALVRTITPEHGGVSLLVKQHLTQRVHVVRTHASMGIMWVRVDAADGGHEPTFLCACYIPPPASQYLLSQRRPEPQGALAPARPGRC